MLLLKKKKYAAVKVALDGSLREVCFCCEFMSSCKTGKVIVTCLMQNIERKGLDMVRRDWSLLSKEIGDFCLNQILSGGQAFKYLFLD